MADRVELKDANEASFYAATDEVTRNALTEHQQVVKIGLGADGSHDGLVDDAFPMPIGPATAGGLSIHRDLDCDENGANIKASAGQLYGFDAMNMSGAYRYLKFFNDSGAPDPSADTPVLTFPLPPGERVVLNEPLGIAFGTGIGIACLTGLADLNNGAPDANDVCVNVFYK